MHACKHGYDVHIMFLVRVAVQIVRVGQISIPVTMSVRSYYIKKYCLIKLLLYQV